MRVLVQTFAHLADSTLSTVTVVDDDGVAGFRCFALERPWKDNEPYVSCIPAGTYPLVWDRSGRRRNVPMVKDVPGRTFIEIHPANFARELQGCLALGLGWACYGTLAQVTESEEAQREFVRALGIADDSDSADDYVWLTERTVERIEEVRVPSPSGYEVEHRRRRVRRVPGCVVEHNEEIATITIVRECRKYPV